MKMIQKLVDFHNKKLWWETVALIYVLEISFWLLHG